MFLRASQFIFLLSLICFIEISIARPKGDDDSETPSESDKDSPKEREPEENKEDATEKALEEEIQKMKEEAAVAVAPAVYKIMQKEAELQAYEADHSTEKPPETEEKSDIAEKEEKSDTAEKEEKSDTAEKDEEPAIPEKEEEEESRNETPEEKPETSSAATVVNTETTVEKEEAPKDTFAVWSDKRKICLLAKFHATFSILYSSQRGEEKAEVTIPKTANSKGKCGPNTKFPVLQLSWGKNVLKMVFNKSDEDNWALTSMELTYDTGEPLFDGAVNAGKKTARSKDITLFETPLKYSYFCNGQEIILLYAGNKQAVTVRIRGLQVQPFEVENGEFSPPQHCTKVAIDDEIPYVQDETVPFAVGCTLALITLIILVGFSIHRAYHAAKVDYNSME